MSYLYVESVFFYFQLVTGDNSSRKRNHGMGTKVNAIDTYLNFDLNLRICRKHDYHQQMTICILFDIFC